MFVGNARIALVHQLLDEFDHLTTRRQPRLVTLSAPTGAGKTRIVRELYAELARRQPPPAYWPATLAVTDVDHRSGRFLDRKVIVHDGPFAAPATSAPSFLWLGARFPDRAGGGGAIPVVASLVDQIRTHLEPAIRSLERRGLRRSQVTRLVRSLAPLPDFVGVLEALTQTSREFAREVTEWRAGRGDRADRIVDLRARDASRQEELEDLLDAVTNGERPIPTVLVLDDAHNLDDTTAGLVTNLLGSDLPLLILATTWPGAVGGHDARTFDRLLSSVRGGERSRLVDVAPLDVEDLEDYVTRLFPGTAPGVARALAIRADHNPYALELLIANPRILRSAATDRGLVLSPAAIDQIAGDLDSLLLDHWHGLSAGHQVVLAAAAHLGPRFLVDAVRSGLASLEPADGDGDEPVDGEWVRRIVAVPGFAEFLERLRFDVARHHAERYFAPGERDLLLAAAAAVVTARWQAADTGPARDALATIVVELGERGHSHDWALAGAAALEMADRLRVDGAGGASVEPARLAVEWFVRGGASMEQQIEAWLTSISVRRTNVSARLATLDEARSLLARAQDALGPGHELTIRCRMSVVRSSRLRTHPDILEDGARELEQALRDVQALAEPSLELRRDALFCRYGFTATRAGSAQAAPIARHALDFCEQEYGRLHRFTLEALSDLGYYVTRIDAGDGVAVRRELLARRVERHGSRQHPRVAMVLNDLAFSLLEVGGEANEVEALAILEDSITTRRRVYGADNFRVWIARLNRTRALIRVGARLRERGDPRGAAMIAQALADAEEILQHRIAHPTSAPGRASAHQRFGEALLVDGRPALAAEQLERALAIHRDEQHLGLGAFAPRRVAESLVHAYRSAGRHLEAEALEVELAGTAPSDEPHDE